MVVSWRSFGFSGDEYDDDDDDDVSALTKVERNSGCIKKQQDMREGC